MATFRTNSDVAHPTTGSYDLTLRCMKPFEQDPITQASQGRSSAPGSRPRNRVSKVCEFTRRRAVPLGLATTIALALTACAAIRNQETARDDRIETESDPAHTTAERAGPETRRQKEVSAPAPVKESPSSEYHGPLRREAERGLLTVRFEVPGNRPDEICVIPRHLPFAHYRGKNGAKDRADERRLASYDFYKAGTAESGAIGISPKRTSTSAAVRVYELPDGTSRPQHLTARYCRSMEKEGKQVAKFKQTDNRYTTTSTASILGYYHISRALGDICEVKPAVLRTMDIPQHKKVVRLASKMGARGTVAKSWALFDRYYANPKRSGVARDLFTSDFTQIYGALLENTRGEDDYTEWLKAESELSSTRAFRYMADARPVASILGSNAFTQRNVQALVAMRDTSELILLDYLLAQSDRLSGGNISSYEFAYDLFGGEVISAKASKAPDRGSSAPRVIVKKLTIKDTDGGLLNSNVFERKGYLTRIRHMHPRTYDALQRFAREWEKDPAVKAFFHEECTFSTSQLARFEEYLRTAAATLRERRESGTLHLDLDLDEFFKGVEPYADDEGLPDIPKLILNEPEVSDWKPLRGATSQAHARILEGQSSASETRFAKLDLDDLPKGVEPYPADKALPDLPRGVTRDTLADIPARQSPTPKAALAKADLEETN